MSIASEKVKLATERFLLLRLNPSRFILPTLTAGLYEITLPFIINSVKRNGVELIKDTTTPTVNDHWFQDEASGLLKIKLAGAPDDTSNILTVNRYLYYTGTIFRALPEDPEDDSTPIRQWVPRILQYPTIIESFDNILAGVFTINDTSIDLINHDSAFQENLTDDDSFYNSTVDIWLCITDVSNIQKIFTGTIKSLSFSRTAVTISCVDSFNKLKDIASCGDSPDEIYYSLSAFPDVDQKFKDKPIPFMVGEYSKFDIRLNFEPIVDQNALIDDATPAVCISSEAPATTSNNRTWGCCRQKGVVQTQVFGTVSDFVNPGGDIFYLNLTSYDNLYIGDTIKYTDGLPSYGQIVSVGAFTYLGNPYNLVIFCPLNEFTPGAVITPLKAFSLNVKDAGGAFQTHIMQERDYTVDDSTVTEGGNRFVKVVFVNNFEINMNFSILNPNAHSIYFRTSNDSPESHSQFLLDVLDRVGLPANTASFTAAQTAFDVNALFSIPNFDEFDFKPYLKYVQDILSSVLAFLKINEDFEVDYEILAPPTSTDIRDSSLMLLDGSSLAVEYQDIVTTLIAYNPHNASLPATLETPSPSETRSNNKAKYIHGIDNTNRFRHCLQSITGRIDQHIGLKSMRSARYRFETATQDIDSELGDDIELRNKIVLGTSDTQDVKIVTIEKSPHKTAIEAADFRGL